VAPELERDVETGWLAILEQPLDEVQEPDDRIHERAVRRSHLGHRVVGAVREARRVDEKGRYAGAAAKTWSSAAMNRPFSAGVPIDTRRQPAQPGHIEMSRMSTPSSRKRACTAAGVSSFIRKRMKFVTDGYVSIALTFRSASYTRRLSRWFCSTRRATDASSRAIFAATACVSVLTLYGSWTARKSSATAGCVTRIPTRRPAAALTLENVLLITMFGCAASSGSSVVRPGPPKTRNVCSRTSLLPLPRTS